MIARNYNGENAALIEDDTSSDTLVMTPPPSYREVSHFWTTSSGSSSQTEAVQTEGSDDYLEPMQTIV